MSKKEGTKKSKGSIQGSVLDDFLDDLNFITELLTLPAYAGPRHNFEAHIAMKEWEQMYGAERKKRRALNELRKKKWITDRRQGQEIVVRIHADAVVAAIKERIGRIEKKLPGGEMCLVSFDFPNGASKARDRWRFMIKQFGFKGVQLSLYSTERLISEEVLALVKALGAEKWVKVYLAREL